MRLLTGSLIAAACAATLFSQRDKRPSESSPAPAGTRTIGGIAIGTQGTGLYSGYTLAGGDAFEGPLSVFNAGDPYARYIPTHVYGPGARALAAPLNYGYDMDPYHTGDSDKNRGVPVGTDDTLVQTAADGLAIKVRVANSSETPYINGRLLVSGMVASGAWMTFTPPAIIEAYVSYSAGAPEGWHPSFWILNANPLDSDDAAPPPGSLEFDISENSSTESHYSFVPHGQTDGFGSFTKNLGSRYLGTGFHLFTLVMGNNNAREYIDGHLVGRIAQDTTNTSRPFYVLLTGHSYSGSWGHGRGIDLAGWTKLGAQGAVMTTKYYRVWLRNARAGEILRPAQPVPILKVGYNQNFTYTFPSASSLWGPGISDYCQAFRFEDFEPGGTAPSHGNGTTHYFPFPAELNWNSSTRVLSGAIVSHSGRLHVGCNPYVRGGDLAYTARGYIDVGPYIAITSLPAATLGSAYGYDLYVQCYVGTLLPKTITLTGLPSGLSFDPASGYITGTPSSAGTFSVAITVTNSSGQSASQTVSLMVR